MTTVCFKQLRGQNHVSWCNYDRSFLGQHHCDHLLVGACHFEMQNHDSPSMWSQDKHLQEHLARGLLWLRQCQEPRQCHRGQLPWQNWLQDTWFWLFMIIHKEWTLNKDVDETTTTTKKNKLKQAQTSLPLAVLESRMNNNFISKPKKNTEHGSSSSRSNSSNNNSNNNNNKKQAVLESRMNNNFISKPTKNTEHISSSSNNNNNNDSNKTHSNKTQKYARSQDQQQTQQQQQWQQQQRSATMLFSSINDSFACFWALLRTVMHCDSMARSAGVPMLPCNVDHEFNSWNLAKKLLGSKMCLSQKTHASVQAHC